MTQSGAQQSQADALASFLNVPTNMVVLTNGELSFIDSTNFMAVPMVPVTDPAVTSNLLAQTTNKFPSIPIRFEKIDFVAASNLTVMPSNAAVSLVSAALANAGLTPQYGTSVVTHTILNAFYTNESGTVLSVSNSIDTEVAYQLSVAAGYPLIGPGAQVQFTFGTNGRVSRVQYAARQLTPGPSVTIISSSVASNRALALFPGLNPRITPQLVYYAPPLSIGSVAAIIPWYRCTGTFNATNPVDGHISTANLMPAMIPATDDAAFVPALTFSANSVAAGTRVSGSARITGGTAPYTYQWSGNSLSAKSNTSADVLYTPTIRVTRPSANVQFLPPASLAVSWFDPSGFFTLESSSNLPAGSWNTVTNPVTTLPSGASMVTLTLPPGQRVFFRLRFSDNPVPNPEKLAVRVTDANGVTVRSSQTISVLATPLIYPIFSILPPYSWGAESPYDPGLGTRDTLDWMVSMVSPTFGVMGIFMTDWASENWDYIDKLTHPFGINDYMVDSADIVLHIGHGDSDEFFFTSPWGTGPLHDTDATDSWGNQQENWFGLLSCNVLQEYDPANKSAIKRWGPNIDGLHLMMGFTTEAGAETGFHKAFAKHMGLNKWYVSIASAWFAAAKDCGTGTPAVLYPVAAGGVNDGNDYWWGLGSVGPRIRSSQIKGWVYTTVK